MPSSCLLALEPCVGSSASSLDEQGLHLVWTLPAYLSGMGGSNGSVCPSSIGLRVIGARKHLLHDMAVVLEQGGCVHAIFISYHTQWTLIAVYPEVKQLELKAKCKIYHVNMCKFYNLAAVPLFIMSVNKKWT
jgi:hypothetical protein